MSKRINAKIVISGIAVLLLLAVIVYSGVKLLEVPESSEPEMIPTKTIERNGVKYFPRQDISVFLIMGIDKEGKVTPSNSYNNDGESDVVALAVFDETAKEYTVICLNRDTMLDMPVLGIGGKYAGTQYAQLALSHTYGKGLADSCENTKKTVSDFLYGLEIDYYVSFNMDAIGILTDAVGGVTVNVTDDFSAVDPSIKMGEVTLNSSQALNFVRTRKGLGDQMNVSRMERHKEFMNGFFEALGKKIDSDSGFLLNTYRGVSEYMVSDCSPEALASVTERYSDYTQKEIISLEGENKTGEKYMEFYADEEKLDALILNMFYSPKK